MKIIQIMTGPQGQLLGLGDDGVVYYEHGIGDGRTIWEVHLSTLPEPEPETKEDLEAYKIIGELSKDVRLAYQERVKMQKGLAKIYWITRNPDMDRMDRLTAISQIADELIEDE